MALGAGLPEFNRTVKNDPLAGNSISLRAAVDLVSIPLPVPLEEFDTVPTLVLNLEEDRMTPSRFTRQAYNLLGTAAKTYVPVPREGHWIVRRERWVRAFDAVADWFEHYNDSSQVESDLFIVRQNLHPLARQRLAA